MKNLLKKYAGVLIGAAYALILRLVFNIDYIDGLFNLFSITFIWLTPIVIGLIPLLYASKEQLKRWGYRITSPVLTVIVFFSLCFMTGIEDLICIWVILIPYVVVAVMVGVLAGELIERIKEKRGTLYSIILLPFIASPIEQ